MPIKLNVGVSRKIGLPEYSSVGASCNVEVELDSSLLQTDPAAFQGQVRSAFTAARQAVSDELERYRAQSPVVTVGGPPAHSPRTNGHAHPNGAGVRTAAPQARPTTVNGTRGRSATPSQVKALYAICQSKGLDLGAVLQAEFGGARPEELSLREASELIDRLKADGDG
jgi:hypothetical protein